MYKSTHPVRGAVLALVALLLALASPAWATPAGGHFTVNTTDDSLGAGGGVVSLRDAITAANASSGLIDFDPTVFDPAHGPYEIDLTSALPDLSNSITITGPGANLLSIVGQGFNAATPYRIFHVMSGQMVAISGLTIKNGVARGALGANGVDAGTPPSNGGDGQGGGIDNQGTLTVTLCYFVNNTALGGTGGTGATGVAQNGALGGSGFGGAIYSEGTLTVSRTTFALNSAGGGTGGQGAYINQNGSGGSGNGNTGGNGFGGAIYQATGSLSLTNSTCSGNTARGGAGGAGGIPNFGGAENAGGQGGNGIGGAVALSANAGSAFIGNCTLGENAANPGDGGSTQNFSTTAAEGSAQGGGIASASSAVSVLIGDTIIAANTTTDAKTFTGQESDLAGAFTSLSFNLVGATDGSAGFANGVNADQAGTLAEPLDARLDPAGALYQTTTDAVPTLRLRKGSPAVDAGKDIVAYGYDELGNLRPHDLDNTVYPNAFDGTDIGAREEVALPDDRPVTSNAMISARVGTALMNQAVTGTDGDADPLTFALVDGDTMPDGLTLNSDGTITGTPTTAGVTTVMFFANDGMEDSTPSTLTISVSELQSVVVDTDQDVVSNTDGLTSLREAISYVTQNNVNMPITFDPTFFATARTITIDPAKGPIQVVDGTLEIDGPAAGVTIFGNNQTALFQFLCFDSQAITLKNLTLSYGVTGSSDGGAFLVEKIGGVSQNVSLSGCAIYACFAPNGGAIGVNGGSLTATNCTIFGNEANGFNGNGGGLRVTGGGSVTLYNCTVSGNEAPNGNGGGIQNDPGTTVTLGNTIVAGNSAGNSADFAGTLTGLGYNLIGDATGTSLTGTLTGDLLGVDAGLDPRGIQNNGGPTPTVALLSGSVALDQGLAMNSVTTDQRGFLRPQDLAAIDNATGGDGSDIGAFEYALPVPVIAVQDPAGNDLASGLDAVSYGRVNVSNSKDLTFTIQNRGQAALSLTGDPLVAVSGTNAADFVVTASPSSNLAPAASTTFTVTFTPSIFGTESATISIASNDSSQNPFAVNLTGQGADTVTQPPTLDAPASGAISRDSIVVSYALPEAAAAGTITLTFDDGVNTPTVVTLPSGTFSTAGGHTTSILASDNNIPDGFYTVTLSYRDVFGNPAATATSANVRIDANPPTVRPITNFSPLTVTVGSAIPNYTSQATSDGGETVTQMVLQGGQPVTTPTFTAAGPATVILSATDEAGNVGSTQFIIQVRSTEVGTTTTASNSIPLPGAGTPGGPAAGSKSFGIYQPAIDQNGNVAYISIYHQPGKHDNGGVFTPLGPVAVVGDSVPGLGNATYASMYDPMIEGGHVGFPALLSGVPTARRMALFNGIPGHVKVIAQTGTVATDVLGQPLTGNPTYKHFNGYEVNGGFSVFQAKLAGHGITAANDSGLWIQDAEGDTSLVLRTGQTVDGHTVKKIVTFMSGNGSPGQGRGWLNTSEGQALALVMFTDGGEAIVNCSPSGTISIISETGTAGPGSPSIAGSSFTSYGVPAINASGITAFLATVNISNLLNVAPGTAPVTRAIGPIRQGQAPATTTVRGVFSNRPFKPQTSLRFVPQIVINEFNPVAVEGQATTLPGVNFATLKDPVLANDGGLAFPAKVAGTGITGVKANTLWWLPPNGGLQLLAQGGQQAGPDVAAGVEWSAFQSLGIAANRGPIFRASLVHGKGGVNASNDDGVWAVDLEGNVRLLFRTGEKGAIVEGKTLKSFQILRAAGSTNGVTRSFNDHQQVVWQAVFTDGTQAFITTVVP